MRIKQGIDQEFWEEAFHHGVRDNNALTHAIHLLKESGALLKTKHKAQVLIEETLEYLKDFPDSPLKTALEDLAHFSIYREA